jgi:hypothetical protein
MLVALCWTSPLASAQTGPSLLLHIWDEAPHFADTFDEPIFILGGHTKDDEDIDLLVYDSFGSIKFDRQSQDPNIWLGYRALTIGIDGDQPELPGDLTDLSLALAIDLGEGDDNWSWSVAFGAGTANDGHWSDTGSIYGIGTLNATHRIDSDSALDIGVWYDGNRTILPDIPLPYAMYRRRVSDEFAYHVGLPYSGLSWRPFDALTAKLEYSFPTNLLASASVDINKEWSVFCEFIETLDAFFIHDEPNRRIFYELSRIDGGIRFAKLPSLDLSVGVGMALHQEFSTGFDVRDLDSIAEPSEEVLYFIRLRGTF